MSEFLAAIAGAAVGGIIAYAVQMIALREGRNSLIGALIPQCQQQEQEAWSVLSRLTALLTSKIGLTLKLELKRDYELKAAKPINPATI